ncbi:MAG: type II toxin-antitoxin system RelB/DinJ family antitoxin [Clostridia bacterium]|nr:type II toxin-antitoxin system RelB/DinJ family antitoxin [Clostridia bacterium]
MATAPTQVRIDADVKSAATELFNSLGLDMSGAVNLFLHQCILRGGLPFAVELPGYSKKTLEAMTEAKRISADPSVKSFTDIDELRAALLE